MLILFTVGTAGDGYECSCSDACAHVRTSWRVSVMDNAHWQPDAKQTPQLLPPTIYDGHNRWTCA